MSPQWAWTLSCQMGRRFASAEVDYGVLYGRSLTKVDEGIIPKISRRTIVGPDGGAVAYLGVYQVYSISEQLRLYSSINKMFHRLC